MPGQHNRELLNRYIEEVWHKNNPEAVDDFLAPTYRRHRSSAAAPLNRQEQKQLLTAFRAAFPDAQIRIEEAIVEGDKIAFRSTIHATHLGPFMDIAPTGRPVTIALLDILRLENGRIVEQWGGPDIYNLLQQLTTE